jgi:hypothetical protein
MIELLLELLIIQNFAFELACLLCPIGCISYDCFSIDQNSNREESVIIAIH